MTKIKPYISLLNLLREERNSSPSDIGHTHEELLAYIAEHNFFDRSIKITDLIYIRDFGTGQTISNKVQNLIDLGYVEQFSDPTDKRIKVLKLTKKAITLFERRTKTMENLCLKIN